MVFDHFCSWFSTNLKVYLSVKGLLQIFTDMHTWCIYCIYVYNYILHCFYALKPADQPALSLRPWNMIWDWTQRWMVYIDDHSWIWLQFPVVCVDIVLPSENHGPVKKMCPKPVTNKSLNYTDAIPTVYQYYLGGGANIFIFHLFGEDSHFDEDFSKGLVQPPTI